jgi:O-acetyl-ADP-ribose deacetylase (regulator of RNase III)
MPPAAPLDAGRIRLVRADITDLDVEAFVYYARSDLALGSGFGTAIALRGGPAVQEQLKTLGPIPVGDAVVTTAGKMKARSIIHAVGPRFQEDQLEEKLRRTVQRALELAEESGFKEIALPAMGAGFYGVPVATSARVVVSAVNRYLDGGGKLERVILCVVDSREFAPFASELAAVAASRPADNSAAPHGGRA